ncbi:MAG: hypothetical protein HQ581_19685, partial [Planctomycetes bacterium]|nr:hypothetical protein [Planctomycetota bacterium]
MTTMVVFVSVAWLAAVEPSLQETPYGVGQWPAAMGNHRARVRVEEEADAVRVHLPWRRRDRNPQEKAIHVVDATDGQRITNVARARIDRESGDLVFQPRNVPGEYYVYYLPSETSGWKSMPSVRYAKWQETADAAWLAEHGLTAEARKQEAWRELPVASVLEFQAISPFDRVDPMEVIATLAEMDTLLATHADRPFLLFAEDREHPIRMTDDLPRHWVRQGPSDGFQARAARGEFYVFQLGVFASQERLEKLHATADELRPSQPGAAAIEASATRCFNLGGVDCQGRPFHKSLCVEPGKVQALWFGVDVPADARPGQYSGQIHVGDGDKRVSIPLQLEVTEQRLEDHGDSDPNRLSRLRWLDSTIAMDEEPTRPFTPVNLGENEVGCLGRRVRLAETGLPKSIRSHFSPTVTHLVSTGREMLAAPVDLVVERNDGTVLPFSGGKVEIVKQTPGRVMWRSNSQSGDLRLDCRAQLEFDGYLDFHLTLTSATDVSVDDVRLEVPFVRDVAKYMMGLGRKGGLRPARHEWRWDPTKRQDRLWIGDVNAGMQCQLRGENYDRPLLNIYYAHKPINLPPAWHNQGQGGVTVCEQGDDRVLLQAYSGARTIRPGQPLHFDFALMLTPVKPLDTAAHWATRYCHAHMPV